MVKKRRHLLKSLTWRISSTLITLLITWIITGHLAVAFAVGSLEFVSKFIWYYVHERLWYRSKWGIGDTKRIDVKTIYRAKK